MRKVKDGKQLTKVDTKILDNCERCVNGGSEGYKVYFKNLMGLNHLINWAKEEHLLDGIVSKVDSIVKNGDFAAHLAQKRFQEYYNISPKSCTPIKLGIDKDTARQAILDTAEVILQVIHKKWPMS